MMPGNAIRRHPVVEERTRQLAGVGGDRPLNRVEMGGTKHGHHHLLHLLPVCEGGLRGRQPPCSSWAWSTPCPSRLIRDFAAKVDKLVVVEELDPIIENYCRQLGLTVSGKEALPLEGEFSQNLVAAKLGGAGTYRHGPGGRHPAPSPGHVRRLPPPRTVLHPGKEQVYRAGRHRLLHPGGGGPSDRHGHDPLHGRVHLRHPRLQQGHWGRRARARRWPSSATPPSCTRA